MGTRLPLGCGPKFIGGSARHVPGREVGRVGGWGVVVLAVAGDIRVADVPRWFGSYFTSAAAVVVPPRLLFRVTRGAAPMLAVKVPVYLPLLPERVPRRAPVLAL